RTADVNSAGRARRRIDRHVVRALASTEVERREPRRALSRVGERCPTNVISWRPATNSCGSAKEQGRQLVCVVHPIKCSETRGVRVSHIDAKGRSVWRERELRPRVGRRSLRGGTTRAKDLVEPHWITRETPTEDTPVEERCVDLRPARWLVEFYMRAAAAEKVTAVRTTGVDRVLRGQDERGGESR